MSPALPLHPIGFIRARKQMKFDARHQPEEAAPEQNVLELEPGHSFEQAVQDLDGFSRIWLVSWFHRNDSWRPLVQPPRGPVRKRGVFATRSPHRPNPIGLTAVQLIAVKGRRLILGPCDLVDGTPIFDIKPYIPAYDAFPAESSGWTGEVDAEHQAPPAFSVSLSPLASAQAEWLHGNWQIDFRPRMGDILSRDPSPHRTRRIKRRSPDAFMIGCGAWRAFFTVRETNVEVTGITPGYPRRFLDDPLRNDLPDKAAQLAFLEQWPDAE